MPDVTIEQTLIAGLLVLRLPVHEDERGWFKENWQREKMVALGLPDFDPVQNNIAHNEARGTTRGIHAEPWDKFVSVASGRIFGAWVDLRAGEGFGTVVTMELGIGDAIFVPRGVANSYQTMAEGTTYAYLVNAHWSPDAEYVFVNLGDPGLDIDWPIPLELAEISEKDLAHPLLASIDPVAVSPPDGDRARTLILGASGQLGRELVKRMPTATAWTRAEYDLGDLEAPSRVDWGRFDIVVNAAAYTQVDQAETPQGRRDAWRVNVHGLVGLARAAIAHDLTLVHISSDYVFDGEIEEHTASETFSPLGVYGQTKAAGDAVVMTVPKHHVVRTSWVVGDGPNFLATLRRFAEDGIDPEVVDDQFGRLTYASDLADEVLRLIAARRYGVQNFSSEGPVTSWFGIAQDVFDRAGADVDRVKPIDSRRSQAMGRAPRPRSSVLATGPED